MGQREDATKYPVVSKPYQQFDALGPSCGGTCRQFAAILKEPPAGGPQSGQQNLPHRIGARSTPTFLVDQMLMSGAYPIEVFRQVLDSIYAAKTARH